MKILPEARKNESGLTQMIMMGESVRQIWVKLKHGQLRLHDQQGVEKVGQQDRPYQAEDVGLGDGPRAIEP